MRGRHGRGMGRETGRGDSSQDGYGSGQGPLRCAGGQGCERTGNNGQQGGGQGEGHGDRDGGVDSRGRAWGWGLPTPWTSPSRRRSWRCFLRAGGNLLSAPWKDPKWSGDCLRGNDPWGLSQEGAKGQQRGGSWHSEGRAGQMENGSGEHRCSRPGSRREPGQLRAGEWVYFGGGGDATWTEGAGERLPQGRPRPLQGTWRSKVSVGREAAAPWPEGGLQGGHPEAAPGPQDTRPAPGPTAGGP